MNLSLRKAEVLVFDGYECTRSPNDLLHYKLPKPHHVVVRESYFQAVLFLVKNEYMDK